MYKTKKKEDIKKVIWTTKLSPLGLQVKVNFLKRSTINYFNGFYKIEHKSLFIEFELQSLVSFRYMFLKKKKTVLYDFQNLLITYSIVTSMYYRPCLKMSKFLLNNKSIYTKKKENLKNSIIF